MCGSMKIGGARFDIQQKVPVLNPETGETQELPWEGHARDDALSLGNWAVRKPEERIALATGYWERSGRGSPLFHPMQDGQAIRLVEADSMIHAGERAVFVVTREITEKEVQYALKMGATPHSRHPVIVQTMVPAQSVLPEPETAQA